jgi:hypothetical protein
MEPIYPLNEETIKTYSGNVVCVVLNDGTRHIGRLSACRSGKIYLNEEASGRDPQFYDGGQSGPRSGHGKSKPKRKSGPTGKQGRRISPPKAATQAYPDAAADSNNPFGPLLVFDLAAIAFLFLILI